MVENEVYSTVGTSDVSCQACECSPVNCTIKGEESRISRKCAHREVGIVAKRRERCSEGGLV